MQDETFHFCVTETSYDSFEIENAIITIGGESDSKRVY